MDNTPLIFVSSEYMKSNSTDVKSKSVCVKASECIMGKYITDITPLLEIDPSIFTCILNTENVDVRLFLLNSVVQDYVHPDMNDLIDILNLKDENIPSSISKQIDILNNYLNCYLHTNFSKSLLEKNEKFNVFNIGKSSSLQSKISYYKRNIEDTENPYQYFEYASALLVHKSLIEFLKQ